MTHYVGNTPQDVLAGIIKRYFYGIRRNIDGELFLIRSDQLAAGQDNPVVINDIGVAEDNFPDFEEGIDFLDGIDEDHNIVYSNLRYPQIKWEGRSITYFIDDVTGEFTLRVSEGYDFPEGISSPGYGEVADNQVIKQNEGGSDY
jgi:hypothetical protein